MWAERKMVDIYESAKNAVCIIDDGIEKKQGL